MVAAMQQSEASDLGPKEKLFGSRSRLIIMLLREILANATYSHVFQHESGMKMN
jgi:hypothetical protein